MGQSLVNGGPPPAITTKITQQGDSVQAGQKGGQIPGANPFAGKNCRQKRTVVVNSKLKLQPTGGGRVFREGE